MTLIRTENRHDGRFSLTIQSGESNQTIGFPREFNLDLALHDVDADSTIVASLLAFSTKLWHQKIDSPVSSEALSERMFEAGYPSERMPILDMSGELTDYSLLRQNTLVVLPIGTENSELDVPGPGRRIYAHPLDVANWTGRLFSPSRIFFGTNLPLLEVMGGIDESSLRLAIGVLMANDLRIGKISIPNISPEISESEMFAMSALASSIGIEVDFSSML